MSEQDDVLALAQNINSAGDRELMEARTSLYETRILAREVIRLTALTSPAAGGRNEALEEACIAVCWMCKSPEVDGPARKVDGMWTHGRHNCNAMAIRVLQSPPAPVILGIDYGDSDRTVYHDGRGNEVDPPAPGEMNVAAITKIICPTCKRDRLKESCPAVSPLECGFVVSGGQAVSSLTAALATVRHWDEEKGAYVFASVADILRAPQPAAPLASAVGGMPEEPGYRHELSGHETVPREFYDALRAHALTLKSTNERLAGEVEEVNQRAANLRSGYLKDAAARPETIRREPESAVRAAVIEECAKVCELRAAERRKLNKDANGDDASTRFIEGLANEDDKCRDAIRALQSPPAPGERKGADCWSEGQSHDFVGDHCIKCKAAAPVSQAKGEKLPHLFYWEDAENSWCPADGLEVDDIVTTGIFLSDGDTINIRFKRQDMTQEEFDAIPEG